MSIKLNKQPETHAPHQAVRRVNFVEHHKATSSRTLMRSAVTPPAPSLKRQMKAHSITHAPTLHLSRVGTSIRPERAHRASRVEKSAFVSHFALPDSRSFVNANPPTQPIQSIVHKPEVSQQIQNTEDLFYKAMEKLSSDIKEMEQLPIKKLHQFTKRLVSNRFNQVSLEESN